MPTIPSHTAIKKPLLALLKRKQEDALDEALAYVAKKFKLSKAAQKQQQGRKKETVLQNPLRWARWELQRDGLVRTTRRSHFALV